MNQKGTVYFFTGLSGAGKSTLGGLFYRHLKADHPTVILMDGDYTRPVFCENLGYSNKERMQGSFRFFRVAKFLADQGMDVVCCAICMHSAVRQWSREHIENYREIYVRVDKKTLFQRDQKGLYSSGDGNVMGIDVPFDEPQNPDFILQNDGLSSPEELIFHLEQALNKPLDPGTVIGTDR